VIGGGYIGSELAQAMRRFGSKVSVIDVAKRLMPREDEDVSEGLRTLLEDEGIAIHLDAGITRVSGQSGDSVRIVVEHNGAEHVLAGSRLLVATGRTPVTDLPRTSGDPPGALAWRNAAGPWQTAPTGFPAAYKASIRRMEWRSSDRSHSGPWPPG
jgi:NADPH-dependent 2,4-dienoyl-CoA reductase/sulfur reductase-like enzyme